MKDLRVEFLERTVQNEAVNILQLTQIDSFILLRLQ